MATRTIIKYETEKGKVARYEVMRDHQPACIPFLGGKAVAFRAQNDGAMHVVSESLVREIYKQVEDPMYGTWKRTETVTL